MYTNLCGRKHHPVFRRFVKKQNSVGIASAVLMRLMYAIVAKHVFSFIPSYHTKVGLSSHRQWFMQTSGQGRRRNDGVVETYVLHIFLPPFSISAWK
jgi:hypothetical protein